MDCSGGSVCEFEITDTDFSEEFTAIPRPGYQFVRWQAGANLFCSDAEGPTCLLQTPENKAYAERIVNSLSVVSIMPVYADTGMDSDGDGFLDSNDSCPYLGETGFIDDTGCPLPALRDRDGDGFVDADDFCPDLGLPGYIDDLGCPLPFATVLAPDRNEWSQPMEFLGLTWDEVNSVCPDGVCTGVLNGYDVTGWTWATIEQANAVFNSYGHSPLMGPGPDTYSARGGTYWRGVWDFFCVDGEQFSGSDDCFIPTGSAQPVSDTLSALLSGVPSEVSMEHNLVWGDLYPQFPIPDRYTSRVIDAASANTPQSGRGVLLFR